MAMNNVYLDFIATAGTGEISYVALANSGTEITGGTYARQSITWNASSSGSVVSSNQPVFDIPAGSTVNQVLFYSAVTAGTSYGTTAVTEETFAGAGTYTLSSATINHNAV